MTDPTTPKPGVPTWIARQTPTVRKLIIAASVVAIILIVWLAIIPLMQSIFDAGQRSMQTPS